MPPRTYPSRAPLTEPGRTPAGRATGRAGVAIMGRAGVAGSGVAARGLGVEDEAADPAWTMSAVTGKAKPQPGHLMVLPIGGAWLDFRTARQRGQAILVVAMGIPAGEAWE